MLKNKIRPAQYSNCCELALQDDFSVVTIVDNNTIQHLELLGCSKLQAHQRYAKVLFAGKVILFHRLVVQAQANQEVDHLNGNPLDNRLANLRIATRSQNMCNRPKWMQNTTSKYKGVCWCKVKRKWRSSIKINRRAQKHLGYFAAELEAAKAYDIAAVKFHREFANLNFPVQDYV